MQRAKKAVQAQLRAQGRKLHDFSAREITLMAEAELERNRDRLIAEAKQSIETWPGFARYRLGANLESDAQRSGHCSSDEIVGRTQVQNGGANDRWICTHEYRWPEPCCARCSAARSWLRTALCREGKRAKTDRAALTRAIAALADGDALIVTKLDRLARSTRDLLNTLDAISKAGASFKSLGDGWADTTTPHGRLMLTVLGGLAEFERHLILTRTSEGRQRAQQRGVQFGRKRKLTAHQQQEALARRARGEALVDIARSYAVSHSTISRL